MNVAAKNMRQLIGVIITTNCAMEKENLYVEHVSAKKVSVDMIKARYYQTILPYEVTQHLMNSRKYVIHEAFNMGKGTDLIRKLPFEDFLLLVENNVPMIFNFTIAVNTIAKVRIHS